MALVVAIPNLLFIATTCLLILLVSGTVLVLGRETSTLPQLLAGTVRTVCAGATGGERIPLAAVMMGGLAVYFGIGQRRTMAGLRRGYRLASRWVLAHFLALAITGHCPTCAGRSIPSHAAGAGSGQIAQLISDIAIAVVRLMVASGAALFVWGWRGRVRRRPGVGAGSGGTAARGLVRVVGVVGAFLFLLVSFGLSRGFVDLIIAQFVDRGALSPPVPGPVDVYVPNNGSGLQPLAGVIGEALQVVLFLICAWFMVSMLVAVINGEIGVATGSPGAMARLVERVITSLVVLLIGVLAPSLARDLGGAVSGMGVVSSAGQAVQLYAVVFTVIVDILTAVLVAVLVLSVVGTGFSAQVSAFLGIPSALASGGSRVVAGLTIACSGIWGSQRREFGCCCLY